ncbi:hypothetical protein HPB50_021124 [Hyalomma asiaticum]|uniref:Uncharacterized protein n=1 Tax=Hyalomma asiaticum TaxID=266040 RepID=A0ACB7T8Y2_HYAAI|nr:hypothetical protein HPB50_021124 [Hyalomma asiaticum]
MHASVAARLRRLPPPPVDANAALAATASNDSSTPTNEAAESTPDTPPVTSPPASLSPTAPPPEPVHQDPAASLDARADVDRSQTPLIAETQPDLLGDLTTTLRLLLAEAATATAWSTCEDCWSRAVPLVSAAVRLPPHSNDYRPRASLRDRPTPGGFLATGNCSWIRHGAGYQSRSTSASSDRTTSQDQATTTGPGEELLPAGSFLPGLAMPRGSSPRRPPGGRAKDPGTSTPSSSSSSTDRRDQPGPSRRARLPRRPSARRRGASGSSTSSWSSSDSGGGPGPSRRPRPPLPTRRRRASSTGDESPARSPRRRPRRDEPASSPPTSSRAQGTGSPKGPPHAPPVPNPCQDGARLQVFFPVPQPLRCTEGGCSHEYGSASWTGRVHSLMRHLERDHRARIEERHFTCSRCGEDLSPRPSGLLCFEGGLPDHQTSQERHQCPRCPLSYSTAGALRNHTRRHQVEDARASRSTAEPPAGPTSKVRRIGTPLGVGTSPDVNNTDAPPPSPPESVAPPTSPHAPSSPTGSDGPPAGRRSGDVDDDATGLLEAPARALRSLLREPPSQDSWDRCEAA